MTSTITPTDRSPARRSGPGRAQTIPTAAVGSTQRAAARNRSRVAIGTFLMLASALGIGVLFAKAANRSPVLAVARSVTAGDVIERDDLREVMVGSNDFASTIPAAESPKIVGRIAVVDLVPDSLLARGQLAAGPTSGTGLSVIGATLKEGHFPSELRIGDRVLALVLPPESADITGEAGAGPPPVHAAVVGLRPLESGGGVAISLSVRPEQSAALAIAGARSRLTVVLAPR